MNVKRMIASCLVIVGAILFFVSIAVPWWSGTSTYSAEGIAETGTENFYPGTNFNMQCAGTVCLYSSETVSYTSQHLTNIGNIYSGVEVLLIVAGVVALLGAICGLIWTFATFGRWQFIVTFFLVITVIVIAVVAPVWVALAQPGAYTNDEGSCPSYASPCNAFSGNTCPPVSGASSCTWGAGAGYFLDIIGVVLIAVGLFLFIIARRDPYGAQASSGTPMAPAQSSWGQTPPATASATPATYAAPQAAPTPSGGAAPVCKTCGQSTQFVTQYGRYYCFHCSQYV
jgi:hypothetical protein